MANRDNLEALTAALDRMQRLASVGMLTASVAHELNNPISVITTSCNDLITQAQEGALSREDLARHLQIIEHSAWRCARLVQTLRTYTHIDSPQVVQTTLNKIIEDALTLVAYQFHRQYNVIIETDLDPNLRPVVWDQNQITQVLINLLTNARDALRPGGGEIRIVSWAVPAGDAVAFSVTDSGPGIPPEHLEKVFDPFFTTKPAGEGTGLGLSIAANIVEQHQGRLQVKNDPAGGATFTVILPCHPHKISDQSPVVSHQFAPG